MISSDATAYNIVLLPGRLSPGFHPDVVTYTTIVPEGTTSVYVRPYVSDPGSTVTGDGNIDVSSGSATVEIVITAEDGISTKTYTIEITVDSSIGLEDHKSGGVSLYPNPVPAGKILHLEGVQGGERVSILDMSGRVIFTQKLQTSEHEVIRLDHQINTGTYIVKVLSRNGTYTQLLMID